MNPTTIAVWISGPERAIDLDPVVGHADRHLQRAIICGKGDPLASECAATLVVGRSDRPPSSRTPRGRRPSHRRCRSGASELGPHRLAVVLDPAGVVGPRSPHLCGQSFALPSRFTDHEHGSRRHATPAPRGRSSVSRGQTSVPETSAAAPCRSAPGHYPGWPLVAPRIRVVTSRHSVSTIRLRLSSS